MMNNIAIPQTSGFGQKQKSPSSLGGLRQSWTAKLSRNQLAETNDGKEATYWYLHGFRTGRGDELHRSPPIWQWQDWTTWRRGIREGAKWAV